MTPERLVAYVLGTHALEGIFFSPEFKEKLMKYAVRKHYKEMTLSEYCQEHNLTLVVDEHADGFQASVFAPDGSNYAVGNNRKPSHYDALASLCAFINCDHSVRVIPGTDLEAE